MRDDGVERAIAFVTCVFSSYSGCRQYRENIERARLAVGEGAPVVDKLRVFSDHPGFIEPMVDNVVGRDCTRSSRRARRVSHLAFTAHSIPIVDGLDE